MAETNERVRDEAAVARFEERFVSALVALGMPRMPSRVFVALITTDSGRLTAAELAERLQVSPAAISGAVRYLTQVDMVRRVREPGSRRDHVQVDDNVWYESLNRRDSVITRLIGCMREGLDAVGPDSPAGHRLAESLAFYEFLIQRLPGLLEQWREHKAAQGLR